METSKIRPPQFATSEHNPCGLDGIDFVEFASPDPAGLERIFFALGFSKTMRHATRAVDLYEQGDIHLIVNREPDTHAARFARVHGPSICSMGWRVRSARDALTNAVCRGALMCKRGDHTDGAHTLPAMYGIGASLIYFVERALDEGKWRRLGFVPHDHPVRVPSKGFFAIDHLTNNVEHGTMEHWAGFYGNVFGFENVRYFDIRGERTGLTSHALRSPCGRFCIPINEAAETRSQINEYLTEYRGPGIQHLAFMTDDLLGSLRALEGSAIEMLDVDGSYYEQVFRRVPGVEESHDEIRRQSVLVDGDEQGYLLQIFTKNLVGPIFIELIQRHDHLSFGEGNFTALFRSIERDQERRGYLL